MEARIAFGAELVARRANLSPDWEANRDIACDSDDLALKLCLVHPEWYSPSAALGQPDPRGPRAFAIRPPVGQRCQSSYIWGYECSIPSVRPSADHLFPYEAGGLTDARNLVWLCEWHNRVKSNDVHLLPWDLMDIGWLPGLLDRVAVRRDLLRRLEQ